MKRTSTWQQALRPFHTWAGLIFGWLLFVIFFTGTLAVFEEEITHWMQPVGRAETVTPHEALEAADKKLRLLAPQADSWTIAMPQARSQALEIGWTNGKIKQEKQLDGASGKILAVPETDGGRFFSLFHFQLHSGKIGEWLVTISGVMMLAALVSGIVLHRRVFHDFFAGRWRPNWLSFHLMSGAATLPFVVMITYTGLTITFFSLLTAVPQVLYGNQWQGAYRLIAQPFDRPPVTASAPLRPLPELLSRAEAELGAGTIGFIRVTQPGKTQAVVTFYRKVDDTLVAIASRAAFDGVSGELLGSQTSWNERVTWHRMMVGLHIGKFGGYPVAWLYFIAGLLSSAMIAAGLVFFSVKRRPQQARQGTILRMVYRALESINVAVIAGLLIACAAYFWGNRLLPATLAHRADAEVQVFLISWAAMLVHALARTPQRAWLEQLSLAAVLWGGIPVLNSLTSQAGFSRSWQRGDGVMCSVDAMALLGGMALAGIAWRLYRRNAGRPVEQLGGSKNWLRTG